MANFVPVASDRLLASIDFGSNVLTMLGPEIGGFEGIAANSVNGDLNIAENRWNGLPNSNEYQVFGSKFDSRELVSVGNLNSGIAIHDNATGNAYALYSPIGVHGRFGMISPNSDHFVAVRPNGQGWEYSNNQEWVGFSPMFGDRIVAHLFLDSDFALPTAGQIGNFNGINFGSEASDLRFIPNQFGGTSNAGEFQVLGSFFEVNYHVEQVGELKFGIAVKDDAVGIGYLIYSRASVFDRFVAAHPHPLNSEHFVAVRNGSQGWEYNDNNNWILFSPEEGDRLLAEIDFSNDTIDSLMGEDGVFEGIDLGYFPGDLQFWADRWNGASNNGEFEVTGTVFLA